MIDHISEDYFLDSNGKVRVPYWTIGAYLCYYFNCFHHNEDITVKEIKLKEMINFRKRIAFALHEEGFFRKRARQSDSDDSDVLSQLTQLKRQLTRKHQCLLSGIRKRKRKCRLKRK